MPMNTIGPNADTWAEYAESRKAKAYRMRRDPNVRHSCPVPTNEPAGTFTVGTVIVSMVVESRTYRDGQSEPTREALSLRWEQYGETRTIVIPATSTVGDLMTTIRHHAAPQWKEVE